MGKKCVIVLVLVPLAAAQHPAPPSAETALDKGIEEFRQGRYSDAHRDLDKAVHLSPADARAITYLLLTRAAFGDCSMPVFDELRQQYYRNTGPEIRRLTGIAVMRCMAAYGQWADSLPILMQLRKSFPDDPEVLYISAQILNRGWSSSVSELRQKAPGSYRWHQLAAESLEAQGHYAEAAAEYRKAIEKNPAALGLHDELGRALLAAADPASLEAARQAFEAELNLNPSSAIAEFHLGQLMAAQKKTDEAAAYFEKALELAPKSTEVMIALAKTKIELQKYKDAIALLERAIELQPTLEAAHYNLMLAYRAAGKNKQADREQAEVDKLHSNAAP